jgi:hypothetical protein
MTARRQRRVRNVTARHAPAASAVARPPRKTSKANAADPWLDQEEARALFDRAARQYLHMSGNEFLGRWRRGEFKEPDALPHVTYLITLLPLVERSSA